jgi:hypothetical protein
MLSMTSCSTVISTGTGGEEDVLALHPDQWRELLVSGYERSKALVEAERLVLSYWRT